MSGESGVAATGETPSEGAWEDFGRPAGPVLIVLSGPSGVGKTTIVQTLMERGWSGYSAITVTTRSPSANEINGLHYHFRTPTEFQSMIAAGEFLEYANLNGYWYGFQHLPLRTTLAEGRDVILVVDPQSAQTIRTLTSGSVSVFVVPETLAQLQQQLTDRDLANGVRDSHHLDSCDLGFERLRDFEYKITNRPGKIDEAVDQLIAIITAEHARVHSRISEIVVTS